MVIRSLKRRFTKAISRFYDPLVVLTIGTEKIKVRLSHQLREILAVFPQYNHNLGRIIKYTEHINGKISLIDIGANVGDTVAFVRNYSNIPILCIDGEEEYVSILRQNVAQYENVHICQALVGKENRDERIKLKVEKGTAHIEESKTTVKVRTLENILEEFPKFSNSKILKSDTDGFDTWILRSCTDYLKTSKPILFFEFDPHFIKKNGDDPWDFLKYLKDTGYSYLIFYTNIGDYMLGCDIHNEKVVNQLIHYFSGRNIEMFADICAFHAEDQDIFEYTMDQEIKHFRQVRDY